MFLLSSIFTINPTYSVIIVYEGDKIREEQQKRIEDELQEIAMPTSPEADKESLRQQHIEVK